MIKIYDCNIFSYWDIEVWNFVDIELANKKAIELAKNMLQFERVEVRINWLLYKKFDGKKS